jgi:hypothetical protein
MSVTCCGLNVVGTADRGQYQALKIGWKLQIVVRYGLPLSLNWDAEVLAMPLEIDGTLKDWIVLA